MVLAYLDIETYSPLEEPSFEDKVILICLKIKKELVFLKEWESDEKEVLTQFYRFLKEEEKKETVTLVGWNIVRFDVPFLTYRLWKHCINSLYDIFEVFRKTYWRDLRQCLLPFNKYKFKGLSEEETAKRFKIQPPLYSNKDVASFYERKDFEAIEKHTLSELKFLSDLSWKMRDLEEIRKAFSNE